jgi:N-formylmaleamate deformylase
MAQLTTACWIRLARALQAEYDIVMPDARAHGLSESPARDYTSADHAADLAGLMRGLGVRKAVVGGHSMGASAALRLAADEPDLVSCAILEDPPFRTTQSTSPAERDTRDAIIRSVLDARASDVESTIRRSREFSLS